MLLAEEIFQESVSLDKLTVDIYSGAIIVLAQPVNALDTPASF